MIRVDLHTHSQASPDGSLSLADYQQALDSGKLDCIAITDHDQINFALEVQAKLGKKIIVGEEITTTDGEIIGLYLHQLIPAGLSAAETIQHVHKQGGLVYIPHPFETIRNGISLDALNRLAGQVDIVEIYNGRSLQNQSTQAAKWATEHQKAGASSSDAHGRIGWSKTYTTLAGLPRRQNLVKLLESGTVHAHSAGIIAKLYPKLNRLKGKL